MREFSKGWRRKVGCVLRGRALDDFGLPFPVVCTPKDMMDAFENEADN